MGRRMNGWQALPIVADDARGAAQCTSASIDIGKKMAQCAWDRNASSKRPGLQFNFRPEPIRVSVILAPAEVGRKEHPWRYLQCCKEIR